MCDLNGPFKLCTCESIADRSKPHWVLHRTLIQKDENNFIIGMLIGPNPYELYLSKNLKKRLNSCNVFDFEYQPQEGDCLELFTETISDPEDELEVLEPSHRFEFKNSKWKAIEPFDGSQYQHKNTDAGPIIGPQSEVTKAYEHFLQVAPQEKKDEFNQSIYSLEKTSFQISKKYLLDYFIKNK
ncbi:MAG: hypothetical protein ACKOWQ_08135 [Aquirufa sp.]